MQKVLNTLYIFLNTSMHIWLEYLLHVSQCLIDIMYSQTCISQITPMPVWRSGLVV